VTNSAVAYRALTAGDVPQCADLHCAAFPGFFLSTLGPPFLRQLYRGYVDDPAAVTVVAVGTDNRVLGVVVGTTTPSGFFRRLLIRRWYGFALASLRLVLRRPSVAPRLGRALFYRGLPDRRDEGALLSSICVAPEVQGSPVARLLISRWVHQLPGRGVTVAHLSTDRDGNDKANRFYAQAGWILGDTYTTTQGREMNVYSWTSDGSSPPANDGGTSHG
jgi:ribosomal protein S18 acetylase RimI-like enzyme